jgi:glycosyltransferase involved in cell wall biosynthesis
MASDYSPGAIGNWDDRHVRVIAIIASYNERRFIDPCLEHLHRHGVDSYLIDNRSTDGTVERAEGWLAKGLVGIESFPREKDDIYAWRSLLARKEEVARELDADWFIHLDPDEIRLPPSEKQTLAAALQAVDREGFNAVNFAEFTFIPTREEPDHDHSDFQQTLLTYYPFEPRFPHKLTAWKAGPKVELASSAGHRLSFPGMRMYPKPFPMKHYLFLSVSHAIEKYVARNYDPAEVESGWHGWRARIAPADIRLPSKRELRAARFDEGLDPSDPRTRHYVDVS